MGQDYLRCIGLLDFSLPSTHKHRHQQLLLTLPIEFQGHGTCLVKTIGHMKLVKAWTLIINNLTDHEKYKIKYKMEQSLQKLENNTPQEE